MRGHVRKRGESWTVVYDEPRGETEKRTQRSKGGFKTKREAERFLTETLARLGDGSYTAPSKLTLGEYLSEWLPAIERTLRPSSFESDSRIVQKRIAPAIGTRRLQALSGSDLNAFYGELEREGLSVATRRLTHAVLHRALRDAVRWGKLARSPADQADPPAVPQTRVQAWTDGELRRFLEQVADDALYPLWRLAATTGMRRGELLGLTWRSTDLNAARLSVEQQLLQIRGGVTVGPPKSTRSRRTIALDPETVDALRRQRDAQLLERDFAGNAYVDGDFVFADPLGKPIRPERLGNWFRGHREAAGIPSGSLHTLRHTAATLALTSGVPVHIVAARLGDDPRVVLSTYAHLLPRSDELAAERVAALLA
jgi:integrase